MPIQDIIFQVGDVIFLDFEVPEMLEDLGGTQLMAEHRYPGGTITQQVFGAFPSEIQFSGILTGPNALGRMDEIDRLRVAGEEVPLTYGTHSFLGIVTQFTINVRTQWYVRYRLRFRPRLDLTSDIPEDNGLAAYNITMDALNQLQIIASIIAGEAVTVASTVPFAGSALDSTVIEYYMPLPARLSPLLGSFIIDSQQAILQAQGILSAIPFNSAQLIYADAQALLAQALPLINDADARVASPALDTVGYVNTVTATIASPTLKNQTVVQAVNPNLAMLAAQYYGDATKWPTIAAANSIVPPDPLPVGSFALVIPPAATA